MSEKNNNTENSTPKKNGGLIAAVIIIVILLVTAIFVAGIYLGKTMGNDNNAEIKQVSSEESENDSLSDVIENYASVDSINNEELISKDEVDQIKADANKEAEKLKNYSGTLKLDQDKPIMVFLGDTVYEDHRDGESNIPYLIAERCGANCINLSIENAPASISPEANIDDPKSYAHSGVGVADAMAGVLDVNELDNSPAKSIIKENPNIFKEADVFVIEYGIYDFLAVNRIDNADWSNDPASYYGALNRIIKDIRTVAPYASILVMKPTMCEFYDEEGNHLGGKNFYRNMYGTLFDYQGKVDCVDDWDNGILSYDTEIENGINQYSADECLSDDGIRLTEAGRRKYADMVGGMINRNIFETEPPLEQ